RVDDRFWRADHRRSHGGQPVPRRQAGLFIRAWRGGRRLVFSFRRSFRQAARLWRDDCDRDRPRRGFHRCLCYLIFEPVHLEKAPGNRGLFVLEIWRIALAPRPVIGLERVIIGSIGAITIVAPAHMRVAAAIDRRCAVAVGRRRSPIASVIAIVWTVTRVVMPPVAAMFAPVATIAPVIVILDLMHIRRRILCGWRRH